MTRIKRKKKTISPAGIVILLLLIAGITGYFFWPTPLSPPEFIDQGTESPADDPSIRPESGPSEAATTLPPLPAGDSPEINDFSSAPTDLPVAQNPCQEVAEKLTAFFRELDQKEYVASFEFPDGSQQYLSNISRKLLANPPIVVRENDDLFSILKNLTHLYRVLGREDLQILKEILSRESQEMENLMSLVFRWSETSDQCGPAERSDDRVPLPDLPAAGLYEYAGFFLNTMGGQAYLYRRDPALRILMRYYSVLILDRADAAGTNRHGIDIRYPLNSLVSEMESFSGLADRTSYLKVLYGMQERYQARYGGDGGSHPVP